MLMGRLVGAGGMEWQPAGLVRRNEYPKAVLRPQGVSCKAVVRISLGRSVASEHLCKPALVA